ncbi:leucine-rich repeat neuronal protein 4 isoform X1 [Alligator mississippiensis]|nr:leucine-rich repeat neuronal protein 4 isoform X1 [Alligator mississippiensis]
MFSLLLTLSLLVLKVASGPTKRAESLTLGDFMNVFLLAEESSWKNVNLSSMSCEDMKNNTWTILHLTNHSLSSFPACLPEVVETLDLSTNVLSMLNGTEIMNLPNLRILSLRQNNIEEVIWGSEALSSLRFLDLSLNKLSSVPSCQGSYLPNLKWLSLAGNPITQIKPLAFSCYPQLQFLNLSATLLGQDTGGGIRESAFAMRMLPGDTSRRSDNTIHVLDLSGTSLEKLQQEWTQDLPNLSSLHLTRMARLRSLDTELFKSMPRLRELNCQDSHMLSSVRTKIFEDAPHLRFLIFQNCNLSSFDPWNTSSSESVVINLSGNPLQCNCKLSWLLSDPARIVLERRANTTCNTAPRDRDTTSSSLSLLLLYEECQSRRNDTLPESVTPFHKDSPSHVTINNPTSAAMLTDPALVSLDVVSDAIVSQSTVSVTGMELIKEKPTQGIHPLYKEEAFSKSVDSPSTVTPEATSSDILEELSSNSFMEHNTVITTQTDQSKENTTIAINLFHYEGKLHQFTNDPSTDVSVTDSPMMLSELSKYSLTPQDTINTSPTDQLQQGSFKAKSNPDPTQTGIPIHYVEDYEYEEEEATTQPRHVPCDYNPCKHLQKPCSELQTLSPCLCPGVSGEDTVPDSPRLREVSEITDTSALIHWCAPNSVVNSYQLVFHAEGSEEGQTSFDEIYTTARQHTLYKLSPDTTYQVCVIALNKAGASQRERVLSNPCTQFKTKPSYKTILAALSATSGLFLLTTIILSACLCKKCKKPQAEQYGTHLVSYKNPAFDYPLKLQTYN